MSSEFDSVRSICIVSSWFPNIENPNLGSFVYNFARNMAEAGFQVSVIAPLHRGEMPFQYKDLISIYRLSTTGAIFSLSKLIDSIDPDIVHIHAPNLFSGLAAIHIKLKLKKRILVATVHRAEIDRISFLMHQFRRIILRLFERVVAVSEYTKFLALKAGVRGDKIQVIYNSANQDEFQLRDKLKAKESLGFDTRKKAILYAGNLVKIKGIYLLLESIQEISKERADFVLLIAGNGEERTNLENKVKRNGLDSFVKFLGWLPQKELSKLYNASDIFVLPSVVEGHSVALLEAMATGLAIVASDAGGNRESIDNEINGLLFEKNNKKDLKRCIARLLDNPSLAELISKNAIATYTARFSKDAQVKAHIEMYKSLTNALHENKKFRGANKNGNNPWQIKSNTRSRVLLFDNQGLSHYTFYMASGLARYCDVTLYGFTDDNTLISSKASTINYLDFKKKIGNPPVIVRPLYFIIPLLKALKRKDYDIVHFQGHLPMIFLFLPFIKIRGKKICWTIHDVSLRPSSRGLKGILELYFVRLSTQPGFLARLSDSIIVHGKVLKGNLVMQGVDSKKIHIMPHFDYRYLKAAEDIEQVKAYKKDGIESKGGWKEKKMSFLNDFGSDYILLFGRIAPYKGIDVLIKASEIIKEKMGDGFEILIAGKGNTKFFENSLDNSFHCIRVYNEYIPNYRLTDLFSQARFVVLPYTDGSQSGVVPLAYTFSKPVIVSDVGSIAEYVDHGKTGFIFQSGNAEQLAKYMIELIENKFRCEQMGRNAYQKLLGDMSIEKCCEMILGIYKRI